MDNKMTLLQTLGILHLFHGPSLIILPLLYDNYTGDLLYLDYFYFMMFCYTFFNRECPITYIAKISENPRYIPGTRLNEYPEMRSIFPRDNADMISQYFFGFTTVGYFSSLSYVIHRANIQKELIFIPSVVLIGYFSAPRMDGEDFIHYQLLTRWIMLTCIFFMTNSALYHMPS
jgi:hypothetical protein